MATACQMIDVAKQCGADAVKFQTYVTERICRIDNPEYDMLKRCELSYDDFRSLFKYATDKGIDFISTPDTVEDAEFLDTLGMRYMKIGSANATKSFIQSISHIRTTLIVSLGMRSYWTDVSYEPNVGMHCVSSYPCPIEQANMKRVDGLKISGFSDHTIGHLCAVMAVARGAKFIEKHFTLDRSAEGPDHHMSMEPIEFSYYVQAIRMAERALGDGVRRVMPCEEKTIAQLKARKFVSEYGL
jgi:sialic acid synthase SpsE